MEWHWAFSLGCGVVVHGKVLCVAHGVSTQGCIPWNGIGMILGWIHGKAFWVAHVLPTHWAFHGMVLGFLLGVHGKVLWVAHGDP